MTQQSSPFYTEDHDSYREVVRQFTEKEITPNVHQWDLDGEVPVTCTGPPVPSACLVTGSMRSTAVTVSGTP